MTQTKSIAPAGALTRFLSRERLTEMARACGVMQRERKTDMFALVWALVLGFQSGSERTIEGLRHSYQVISGHGICRSSFYERLTTKLGQMLKRLALDGMQDFLAGAAKAGGYLSGFKELLAMDATVLRLRDLLARSLRGCRTNHSKAAAKLHAVINVLDGSPSRLKLTSARTNDQTPWRRVGKWLEGRLILFDLGYYSFQLFDRIGRNGGYFLTRLKSNSNPILHTVHRKWRGRAVPVEGQHLRDVLPRLERGLLDVEVHLTFKRRKYKGNRRTDTTPFRLVAVRNKGTGDYHCYLTNVPPHMLPAEDIARTYALRWQVELFFKAMKHHGHLDHLPTTRRPVLDCLIWASILAVLASQALYRLVRKATCKNRPLPLLRWAAIFARIAPALLILLRNPSTRIDRELGRILIRDAPDPNRTRPDRAISRQLLAPVP